MPVRTNYDFTELYNIFKDKIQESSPFRPTNWREGSTARAIGHAVAYLAEIIQLNLNIAFQSFKIRTAKGVHLDRRVADYNIVRKEKSFATTVLTLTLTDDRVDDIVYSAGIIFKTLPDVFGNTKSYELVNTMIATVTDTIITGIIISTVSGNIGNTDVNTIISTDATLVGVESFTNLEIVTNGSERETDEQLRARVPVTIASIKGNGNKSSIEAAAYSVEGVIYCYTLTDVTVSGNFTLYITNKEGVVDSELINNVKKAVEEVVTFPVTFNVISPTAQYITVEADLEINANDYDQDQLILNAKYSLLNYVNNIRRNSLFISDVNFNLRNNVGVSNCKNIKIDGFPVDLELNELFTAKLLNVGSITLNVI